MKKLISLLQLTVVIAGFSTLLVSCSKSSEIPESIVENQNRNYAYGNVTVLDKYGKLTGNNSGVKVTIEGNGISKEVITGNDGKYEFMQVPAGNYQLSFFKEGLAFSGKPVEVKGYTGVSSTFIGPVAEHLLVIDKATIQGQEIQLIMTSNPTPASKQPVGYTVFASNSSDVSAGNAPYYRTTSSEVLDVQTISLEVLEKAGINTNATIHLAIYPTTSGVSTSNVNGVISFPAINLSGKKVISVKK
ncbi:MAG: hypothetical protein IM564_03090 [Chitinophagaceae bacterium]|nr:hypothetical protein [Chitinophagaceae bacterium]